MGKTTRVVVCGMKGVGKTALLEQLIYGNIDAKTVRTWVMLSVSIAVGSGKQSLRTKK